MSPLKELYDTNYENLPPIDPKSMDYRSDGASFEKPEKIGHFSSDLCKKTRTRQMRFDESNLSYLHLPQSRYQLRLDLTKGYDDYIKRINWSNASLDKLDEMLKWILKNRHSLESGNQAKPIDFDFITQRGVLTKIMCTPFVTDEWHIGFTKFKGTIYICPFFNDHDENENNFERLNMASYGGYRFEHYITRSKHHDTDTHSDDFSTTLHEYSVMLKSKINSITNPNGCSLLYVAEVDCLEDKHKDSSRMENFVEIKTTKQIDSTIQNDNFHRYKSSKWWAQSKLVSIDRIICGYKENDLTTVTSIETLYVDSIAQQATRFWNSKDCWNFLDHFLTHVRNLLKNENDPSKVYLFSKERYSSIITSKKLLHAGKLLIIPDWYVDAFKVSKNITKKNESNVKVKRSE